MEEGPQVARFYRDWASSAPDELTTALLLRRAPEVDLVPQALHGQHVVGVVCCWAGPLDRGEKILEPMRRFGSGVVDLTAPRAFARVGELDTPFGSRSSGYLVDIVGVTDSAPGFERERAWARECWSALAPHHAGVYVNWLTEEGRATGARGVRGAPVRASASRLGWRVPRRAPPLKAIAQRDYSVGVISVERGSG
jgi:hypothetical protein